MNVWPCDQLAADTIAAQKEVAKESGVPLSLSITTVEHLVGEAEEMYASGVFESFVDLLEAVFSGHDFLHDIEETAYRKAVGKVFGRRSAYKQQQDAKRGKNAPFAPR